MTRLCRIGLIACVLASFASAATIIAPGGDASTEGDGNNGFPFNITPFGALSMRYQQVYDASNFSTLGGPVLITALDFRPDATNGAAFAATLASIQIDLSTTSATSASLSSNFANNVGANDAVVFSGALSLSSAFTGPSVGPKAFDIIITLATPFLYNPANGSLLMDVRNFSGGTTTQFDADNSSGTIARVWATTAGDATGVINSGTNGLITQFVYSSVSTVPEPVTFSMAGLAVFGLMAGKLRRAKS